MLSYLINKSGL